VDMSAWVSGSDSRKPVKGVHWLLSLPTPLICAKDSQRCERQSALRGRGSSPKTKKHRLTGVADEFEKKVSLYGSSPKAFQWKALSGPIAHWICGSLSTRPFA
jgi:hypothetical protein